MTKSTILILVASFFSIQTYGSEQAVNIDADLPTTSQKLEMNQAQQIQHCEQDLSRTLGIKPSLIKTIKAEQVTWRSGALGCPSPGKQYTQGQVSGIRIVLEANKKQYSYHARANSTPFYCPRPKNKKPTPLYQDR